MDEDFIRTAEDGVYVKLRVSPGAKSTRINGLYGEGALRLSWPPRLSTARLTPRSSVFSRPSWGVSHSEVAVVKGASGRDKLVFVRGTGVGDVRESLSNLVG